MQEGMNIAKPATTIWLVWIIFQQPSLHLESLSKVIKHEQKISSVFGEHVIKQKIFLETQKQRPFRIHVSVH
jgi:hypothetical protein